MAASAFAAGVRPATTFDGLSRAAAEAPRLRSALNVRDVVIGIRVQDTRPPTATAPGGLIHCRRRVATVLPLPRMSNGPPRATSRRKTAAGSSVSKVVGDDAFASYSIQQE